MAKGQGCGYRGGVGSELELQLLLVMVARNQRLRGLVRRGRLTAELQAQEVVLQAEEVVQTHLVQVPRRHSVAMAFAQRRPGPGRSSRSWAAGAGSIQLPRGVRGSWMRIALSTRIASRIGGWHANLSASIWLGWQLRRRR